MGKESSRVLSLLFILLVVNNFCDLNYAPARSISAVHTSDIRPGAVNASLQWNITWGGTQYDAGESIAIQSNDIYVIGRTDSFGNASGNILFAKYDSNGNLLLNRTWGGAGFDVGKGIAVGADGIYGMGYSNSYGSLSYDTVLLKYSFSGDLLWNTSWGGINFDLGSSIALATDGIYVTGYTSSFGEGGYDAFLLKFNSTGQLLWNVTWGGVAAEKAEDVASVPDGALVTGYTNSFDLWNDNVVLLKYDASGNLVWNITWGGSGEEYGEGVAVSADAIYVTGWTNSYGTDASYDAFLAKYDFNGNSIWNATWGGPNDDVGKEIHVNNEGIFVTGITSNNDPNSLDVFFLKYEIDGTLNWTGMWGGHATDNGASIAIGPDGIFITGVTYSFGAGVCDVFILKYNFPSSGNQILDQEPPMPWWIWLIIGGLIATMPIIFMLRRRKWKSRVTSQDKLV